MPRQLSQRLEPAPSTHRVPQFMLRGFWDELSRRGVSLSELERTSGVARPRRDDFATAISRSDVHALYDASIALTGDPLLGLSIGRTMGVASGHLLGHLALASATLAQTIELVTRVQPHREMRLPSLFELADGRMCFGMTGCDKAPSPGARLEAEMTAVLLHDLTLQFIDGNRASPTVQFAFRAPADPSPYRRVFSGSVQFDGEGTFILFPRHALLTRRSGTDAALTEQLVALAQAQYGGAVAPSDDWTARVRRALRAHDAPRLLEAGSLAAQLGVSTRGLSRRLGREGASLSALIDAELYDRACSHLRRPQVTATQVASALGYAELSSFFRAFRRWSGGLTPNAYRRVASDASEPTQPAQARRS